MRGGLLRHRVLIQERSSTQDGAGEPAHTWTTFVSCRASVEPLAGRELFNAQQRQARVTTRIRIRNVDGVLQSMRVVFDTRWYDVLDVIRKNEVRHEMHLMCEELVERPTS